MTSGSVIGVGLGPGDPELVSLKALRIMQQADVVIVPKAKQGGDSRALAIARPHLPPQCRIVEQVLPMSSDRSVLEAAWIDAATLAIAEAKQGRTVAYLVLGDALLYSTWSYVIREIHLQKPTIPTETIPGITAMAACAALLQQPLAEGRSPLLIWPDAPPPDASALFATAPNIVFMKAGPHLSSLARTAAASGAKAFAVRNCGFADQATTSDLNSWPDGGGYFTTVIMNQEIST